MNYSHEVEQMCTVAKGPHHGPAPIPEEGKWVNAYDIKDISGLSHGVGWCAPQRGACKLTRNVKNGIVEEAPVSYTHLDVYKRQIFEPGELRPLAPDILPGTPGLPALPTSLWKAFGWPVPYNRKKFLSFPSRPGYPLWILEEALC